LTSSSQIFDSLFTYLERAFSSSKLPDVVACKERLDSIAKATSLRQQHTQVQHSVVHFDPSGSILPINNLAPSNFPSPITSNLPVLTLTMRLSRPIPNEIWQNVMGHVDDKTTLKAVSEAECVASYEATRAYWRGSSSKSGFLAELEAQPIAQQQLLATFIRHLEIEFKDRDAHQECKGLRFPQLQTLIVRHSDALVFGQNSPPIYAEISHFISARLENLEIGVAGCGEFNLQPAVDNFLTPLSSCSGLQHLTICARVNDASSQDLVAVLDNCTRLDSLVIDKYAEDLVDEMVMEAVANHKSINTLEMDEMDKHLDRRLMSLVGGISKPGTNLAHLYVSMDTAAIRMFLPRLELLKVLHLDVYGAGSIFRHIRHFKQLWSIWLKFDSYVLQDNDLSHLAPLTSLEMLELSGVEWKDGLDARFINADVFATVLGSMPALKSIILHAPNSLGNPFLLAVGRSCRSIKTLNISGQFAFEALIFEQPVLFPCLESLRLGDITPTVGLAHGSHERWAERRAGDLAMHAPKLIRFSGSGVDHTGPGALVEKAWKVLESQRDVHVG
jgi:hypothetical protein